MNKEIALAERLRTFGVPFRVDLVTNGTWSRPALNRPSEVIQEHRGVVIHSTANKSKGANAARHRAYQQNKEKRKSSAHIYVDDSEAVLIIPLDEIAWHAGGSKYTQVGEFLRRGFATPNYTTVGVELCVNQDGDWAKTVQNGVYVAAALLEILDLKIWDLYRHGDVTGKNCPFPFYIPENESMSAGWTRWNGFRDAVRLISDY